jgi:hypothetical protein
VVIRQENGPPDALAIDARAFRAEVAEQEQIVAQGQNAVKANDAGCFQAAAAVLTAPHQDTGGQMTNQADLRVILDRK